MARQQYKSCHEAFYVRVKDFELDLRACEEESVLKLPYWERFTGEGVEDGGAGIPVKILLKATLWVGMMKARLRQRQLQQGHPKENWQGLEEEAKNDWIWGLEKGNWGQWRSNSSGLFCGTRNVVSTFTSLWITYFGEYSWNLNIGSVWFIILVILMFSNYMILFTGLIF